LWRYGLREQASALILAILRAAEALEEHRLPELFCGFDADCGFPVPYEQANIPQAWAAAVPLLAAQLFMGVVPDAPQGRCFVSPWLPRWLPRLALHGVRVGAGRFDITATRHGDETAIEQVEAQGIEIVHGEPEAPLYGAPMQLPQAILRP
jgi:glycogen debranching enzyme